ncbi:MAG: hypothetical protein Ct9H90mP3_8260 [Flammeovirgaceae bacterium]|nr:MAG: hypothetical protein Ct9H90mP3_8260 [Flammeovirgaceae bacterium]
MNLNYLIIKKFVELKGNVKLRKVLQDNDILYSIIFFGTLMILNIY